MIAIPRITTSGSRRSASLASGRAGRAGIRDGRLASVDAEPIDPAQLNTLDQSALADLRIVPHPSAQIVRSRYPIVTIWAMNSGGKRIEPIEHWRGEDALVVRPRLDVEVRLLPPGGATFLSALFTGRTLAVAIEALQWLFWQMAGLGPMAGQNHHFSNYAPEKIPYAIERYVKETNRLYAVLDKRLSDREFVAGRYSIADMAIYPWIVPYERQGQKIEDFPNLKRWFEAIRERPAVTRAYARAKEINTKPTVSEDAKKILFGQSAATVAP